ncbi:MAG: hypothetical protein HQL64_09180 [Magnetococcales bacterium]|nr:hypothetical protein [Magnetococcales bacterium]
MKNVRVSMDRTAPPGDRETSPDYTHPHADAAMVDVVLNRQKQNNPKSTELLFASLI